MRIIFKCMVVALSLSSLFAQDKKRDSWREGEKQRLEKSKKKFLTRKITQDEYMLEYFENSLKLSRFFTKAYEKRKDYYKAVTQKKKLSVKKRKVAKELAGISEEIVKMAPKILTLHNERQYLALRDQINELLKKEIEYKRKGGKEVKRQELFPQEVLKTVKSEGTDKKKKTKSSKKSEKKGQKK